MTSELAYFDPERLDLPSASGAYARRRCLGQYRLIRELRAQGIIGRGPKTDLSDADALCGTRIHAAWAGELSPNALGSDEAGTLGDLRRLEDMVVTDWAGGQEYTLFSREQRLWFHIGLRPRHSGRFDVAYVQREPWRMLILDGKTGYTGAEPADVNDQLRELVALAHHTYPAIEEFSGAILQPNAQVRSSIARFDAFDAELALRMLRQNLEDIEDPHHQRNPGPYCRYCPALAHCPEAQAHVLKLNNLDSQIKAGLFTLPLGAQGAWTIEHLKGAIPIIKRLLEDYKSVLATDPQAIPGWRLKEGKSVRELKDPKVVWEKLHTLSFEEFAGSLSVSVTKLQEIYGAVMKLKGKALTERFNAQLGEALSYRQNDPELEKTSNEFRET